MEVEHDDPSSTAASYQSPSDGGDRMDDELNGSGSPVPPPHRVISEPPVLPKPSVDAEAYKTLGNKFYKAGDFDKAIQEYTKGNACRASSNDLPSPAPVLTMNSSH